MDAIRLGRYSLLSLSIVMLVSCAHLDGAGAEDQSAAHSHPSSESHASQASGDPTSGGGDPASAPRDPDSSPLSLRAALSHPEYSQSAPRSLLLKVDISAAPVAEAKPRRPLNVSLLIDTSGSMDEDEKFRYAMQAAELMVENLRADDIVSIVSFSERALVLSPAGAAANKEFLHHRLRELKPQGWTNLSAGLLEAFAQIDSAQQMDQLQHVIVITDGNANRGVTSPAKLAGMADSARYRGIGVSTFGLGTDFGEKVLIALANSGGGRYTYIGDAEQIPNALATELDGLLEVVAQNVELDVESFPDTDISRVFGQLPEAASPRLSFFLGDIRSGDDSFFLFELKPRQFERGSIAGANVTLRWDNPATSTREERKLQARAAYGTGSSVARSGENVAVELYAKVIDLLERAEEALKGLDTERFELVRNSFDRVYQEVREHAIATRDQQLLNQAFMLRHFMSELSEVQAAGVTHGHDKAQRRIEKEVNYRRYLLEHHRGEESHP